MPEETWLEYQFVLGCRQSAEGKKWLRHLANSCKGGGFCPFYHCHLQWTRVCPPEVADKCAGDCEKFYEKYIKGGKK